MTFIHNSINMSDWLLVGVCGCSCCCFPLYETRWSARPVNRLVFLKFWGRRYRLIYCFVQINVHLRLIQPPTQRWLVSWAQCLRLALNQSLSVQIHLQRWWVNVAGKKANCPVSWCGWEDAVTGIYFYLCRTLCTNHTHPQILFIFLLTN